MDSFIAKYGTKKQFETNTFNEGYQVFTFGKHKNKTYNYVWLNDKPYVAWLLSSSTEQMKYIKKPFEYFKFKVDTEIGL